MAGCRLPDKLPILSMPLNPRNRRRKRKSFAQRPKLIAVDSRLAELDRSMRITPSSLEFGERETEQQQFQTKKNEKLLANKDETSNINKHTVQVEQECFTE